MNGFEKSIKLINMLVQYEATTKKSEPSVLVVEALTSKAKGKGARRWKRKKGKAKAAASALSAPIAPVGMGKGKGKVGPKPIRANDVRMHCREKVIGRESAPSSSPVQVLERSRKLSRDEVVLKLGDGKAVAAEAVGIVHLAVSDQVRIELKDCYYVPSMIENIISISLLDNADVCGPLNTQARDGFFYFITFTDDHSRYGYVYLMRYKSEAFGRFKEFRLEVKNQTGHKIKALRWDRGGEYLRGEFLDYLKENGILS
ncbi:UNVERIFIED_CONTAM: hypothetical protein Slati_3062000 [Sesamum latifolium]|uniref:Integrase catalytic domain-containing protein n=1 Tax=Sesamum latifolium TaxID=2727402 RepID=A0AAW2UWF6_9LAMI